LSSWGFRPHLCRLIRRLLSSNQNGKTDMTRALDFSKIPAVADEAAARLETTVDRLSMWAWPQVFGNTSGPHGGIGGTAMTTFQVLAFEADDGQSILWCDGLWKPWTSRNQQW
jgi:hypothetical protein